MEKKLCRASVSQDDKGLQNKISLVLDEEEFSAQALEESNSCKQLKGHEPSSVDTEV